MIPSFYWIVKWEEDGRSFTADFDTIQEALEEVEAIISQPLKDFVKLDRVPALES